MSESVNLNPENTGGNAGIMSRLKKVIGLIRFRYSIGPRLKIHLNSLILMLPALAQYLFFNELEYLIVFAFCSAFISSLFLLTRARLALTLPFVALSSGPDDGYFAGDVSLRR